MRPRNHGRLLSIKVENCSNLVEPQHHPGLPGWAMPLYVLRLEISELYHLRILQGNDLPVVFCLSCYDRQPTFSLRHLISIWSYLPVERPNGVNDCHIGFDEFDLCLCDTHLALSHNASKNFRVTALDLRSPAGALALSPLH